MKERNWIKSIDISKIELFPLQFVNCDRIIENDVVYIFDEVSSGKTISSGIIALDYLENSPNNSVLVITTNSLARTGVSAPEGQFKRDWIEKLPFNTLGYNKKITVVNNHYSNFRIPKKYGLVIIDEAQLFLNADAERTIGLKHNIRADKVVFLTATPIKSGVSDLYAYVKIAENIIGKQLDRNWIDNIKTTGKAWQEILCSKFVSAQKFVVEKNNKNEYTIMECRREERLSNEEIQIRNRANKRVIKPRFVCT